MTIESQIAILEENVSKILDPEFLFLMNLKYRELHEQLKNKQNEIKV